MGFYFKIHVFLGLVGMSSMAFYFQSKQDLLSTPRGVGIHNLFAWLGFFSSIAAIITTLVNYGFVWAIATVAELFLGALIAMLLPLGIRSFVALASPIVIIGIMGALWGFWYID